MSTPEQNVSSVLFYMLLLAGCVLIFLTPPLQNADEDSHLIRSVMVSEGQLFDRKEGESLGQDVPTSLIAYIESHRDLMREPHARYSYERWYRDSHAVSTDERQLHGYSGQSLSPLYYLPQAAGVWVGKALYFVAPVSFNWAAAGYFARLGNLVAYVLVFAWATRAAPRFAASLAFLAATPMAVSLGASASYDVAVILSAVAFFAATMRAADRKDGPTSYDLWLLCALSFLLGHSKGVYTPVMLSLVCLWRPLGLKRFVKFAIFCAVAAVAGAIFSSMLFGLPDQPHLQAAISAQAQYVISHWLETPGLVLQSAIHFRESLFVTMIGSLGWLNTNFALPILVLWMAVGILAVTSDAGSQPRPPAALITGISMFFGALLALFLLFLAMYISWTSLTTGVGAPLIDSVQGRYLLPLVPYVMGAVVLLGTALLSRPLVERGPALRLQVALTGAILILTLAAVLLRYWVPISA